MIRKIKFPQKTCKTHFITLINIFSRFYKLSKILFKKIFSNTYINFKTNFKIAYTKNRIVSINASQYFFFFNNSQYYENIK